MGSKLDITKPYEVEETTVGIQNMEQSKKEISEAMNTMIPLDYEHFPDREFREYLRENFNTSLDGKIDCSKVKKIYCGTR